MRAIATAGAGFIGSHLVDRLLACGADVIVFDNSDPFYPEAAKEANVADVLPSPRCRRSRWTSAMCPGPRTC
jgi:nucleoside-diphosphate-sugar epimerase